MKQKIVTFFEPFKADGYSTLLVEPGYKVVQILSHAIEGTDVHPEHVSSPRLATTLLLEKID